MNNIKLKKILTITLIIIVIIVCIWLLLCEFDRTHGRKVIPDINMYYFASNFFTGPINLLMAKYTRSPRDNSPFPDMNRNFPDHYKLQHNWRKIRDEVLDLYNGEGMKSIKGDMFFDRIIPDGDSWRKFYIRWHSKIGDDAKAKLPYTSYLIDSIPSIKIAMISVLKPGAVILPHVGPLSICARYHLCLQEGGEGCYIMVDGTKYTWKDGEDVLFDDTYVHEVKNNSNNTRVILFCDIQREYSNCIANRLANFVTYWSKITTRKN
jgi:beta-hydroxylase